MNNQPQLNIDLSQSSEILSSTGGQIFATGYVLRRISKFLIGEDNDAIIPIQVMYDIDTKEILTEMLDPSIRPFYQKEQCL